MTPKIIKTTPLIIASSAVGLGLPSGAQVLGDHHIGTHRQTYKQVDQQIDQRGVGAHSSQGRLSAELAYHHHIRRIEQELQQAGGHQRQRKQQDLVGKRPVAHIDFIALALSSHGSIRHSFPSIPKASDLLWSHSISTI